MSSIHRQPTYIRFQSWREGKVRPVQGNAPHDPAGKPESLFSSLKERLRRSLARHYFTLGPQLAFSKASRNLSIRCRTRHPSKAWAGAAASRTAAPDPSPRTRREDRALLIVSMSSDRLFLDRVGRHQSPSPLHRHAQIIMHFKTAPLKPERSTLPGIGTFYFALTRLVFLYSEVMQLAQLIGWILFSMVPFSQCRSSWAKANYTARRLAECRAANSGKMVIG